MKLMAEENRVYLNNEEGRLVAEVTFPKTSEGVVTIDHTFVDESLRGQGVAGKLMEAAAIHIRAAKQKAVPACTYAAKWFAGHPEYSDILK